MSHVSLKPLNVFIDIPVPASLLESLSAVGAVDARVADPISDQMIERPTELIRDVHVLFCSWPPANVDDMHDLQWMQLASSGFEHVKGYGFDKRGVRVTNARGVFDVPIAEWCIAMMVNLSRDLPTMMRHQQTGQWDRDSRFQTEIRGKTVGIWGYGGLGRATAQLCKALGLRVHVLTRNAALTRVDVFQVDGTGDPEGILPDRVFGENDRQAFLEGLDFLILALPLNDQTRNIVGRREFDMLPPHALFLNPARGPLADEQALIEALQTGTIAGAALDAHFTYPLPPDHPLWTMPNVIITPHISGSNGSTNFKPRISALFHENLQRFSRGDTLLNEISAEKLSE